MLGGGLLGGGLLGGGLLGGRLLGFNSRSLCCNCCSFGLGLLFFSLALASLGDSFGLSGCALGIELTPFLRGLLPLALCLFLFLSCHLFKLVLDSASL